MVSPARKTFVLDGVRYKIGEEMMINGGEFLGCRLINGHVYFWIKQAKFEVIKAEMKNE